MCSPCSSTGMATTRKWAQLSLAAALSSSLPYILCASSPGQAESEYWGDRETRAAGESDYTSSSRMVSGGLRASTLAGKVGESIALPFDSEMVRLDWSLPVFTRAPAPSSSFPPSSSEAFSIVIYQAVSSAVVLDPRTPIGCLGEPQSPKESS